MKFIIKGTLSFGKGLKRAFTKEVEAQSEGAALHKMYALFGSNNGIRRDMIDVENVEAVKHE